MKAVSLKTLFFRLVPALGRVLPDSSISARMQRIRRLGLAVLLLILVVNMVILIRVAWNRQGEPEAELALSGREFSTRNGLFDEDSGRFVRLKIEKTNDWLDAAKLRSLGLDEKPASAQRSREQELVLVLELDGPAHGRALAAQKKLVIQAREELRRADAVLAGLGPEVAPEALTQAKENRKEAAERLERTERGLLVKQNEDSRLYIVDAGLEVQELRQRYPDRSRYALVSGTVRVWWDREGKTHPSSSPDIRDIFVPLRFADAFARIDQLRGEENAAACLHLAFGKRLEPWVRDLQSGK